MDLRKRILTKNDCYKAGKTIKVKGLMLHSTGANNPNLSRYVDAPELDNISSNHWNQPTPGGRQVCVHGFIGLDQNDKVATYQTLPWNHFGWGGGGSSNSTHIHVEICEDNLKDEKYFADVYREAVELFAYLCKEFDLTEKDIITHSEGFKKGIASNHADVMHWFPKHGKSMSTFRADVKKLLGGKTAQPTRPAPKKETKPASKAKTVQQLAEEVIAGKHGTGDARKKSLGSQYDAVQAIINKTFGEKPKVTSKPKAKTVDQLAQEVIDGKHGSGDARKKSLGAQYNAVQKRVNELLGVKSKPKKAEKTISQLADEVIKGMHGSGRDRMRSLGNKYAAVQKEVNRRLK
jgi:N-acetylmuramoyl-L-alanine amidase